MSKRTDAITQTVIAAIGNAAGDQSMDMRCESGMLQRMDSLRLMIAFAEIQDVLGLELEPEQLMQLFLSQSIEDMVVVIGDALS